MPTKPESIAFSYAEKKALYAIAKKTGQSKSSIVRHAFQKYVVNDLHRTIQDETQRVAEDILYEDYKRKARMAKIMNIGEMYGQKNLADANERIEASGRSPETKRYLKKACKDYASQVRKDARKASIYLQRMRRSR